MRILTITNCPALEHLGSGYIIARFVAGMRSLGHQVELLEPEHYEVLPRLRPRANSYRQALGMFLALWRALRSDSYDLVEFWGGESWLAIEWLTRQRGGRPLVVQHTNGPEPRYSQMLEAAGLLKLTPLQRWISYGLVPKAFRSPDAVVTISRYDRDWLEARGWPGSRKTQAIEVPLAECFLGRTAGRRSSRIIGFCGTWLAKKGLGVMVPDLTRLLREFEDWQFLVLGTGPEAGVQSSFPPDIRSRVEVMAMIKDKETLAQQYERMEIFVLPSWIESFGIALAEAMACGCAPVTTPVGFGASLEDGQDALLLEKAESPLLYEAVKRLILNPGLRSEIAGKARQRVQELRWENAVLSLSNIYGTWLTEHRIRSQQSPHS